MRQSHKALTHIFNHATVICVPSGQSLASSYPILRCGGTWSVTMFEFDAIVEHFAGLPKAVARTGMLLWLHTVQYSIQ